MPSSPRGIPGFEITLHIYTVCTLCWLVMPFKLYIIKTVGGMRVCLNAIVAPVGNAGWVSRNTKHDTGR